MSKIQIIFNKTVEKINDKHILTILLLEELSYGSTVVELISQNNLKCLLASKIVDNVVA